MPLPFKTPRPNGLFVRTLASHYENNCGGRGATIEGGKHSMTERWTLMLLIAVGMAASTLSAAWAADDMQKLSGMQIRKKIAGMEMTDDVHWRDVYDRNGKLTRFSMGSKTIGKWRVQKDELCLNIPNDPGSGCYEVWVSGENVELRLPGSSSGLEGVLEKPEPNN